MMDHLRQAWINNELKESNVLMPVNMHRLEINLFKPAHVNALMRGLIQFNKVIMLNNNITPLKKLTCILTTKKKKLKPHCFSNHIELLKKWLMTMSHNVIANWELILIRCVLSRVSLALIFGSMLVNILSTRWKKT